MFMKAISNHVKPILVWKKYIRLKTESMRITTKNE